MKERSADLPVILVTAALLLLALVAPNVGRIVLAIAPEPTLSGASLLEGSFEYEAASGSSGKARYFVRTSSGLHEFYCGPFGARHECFIRPERFRNQPAKVWHTFWHGRLQHSVNLAPGEKAHPLDEPIFSYQEYWRARSGYRSPQINALVVATMALVLLFLVVRRYLKWRDAG